MHLFGSVFFMTFVCDLLSIWCKSDPYVLYIVTENVPWPESSYIMGNSRHSLPGPTHLFCCFGVEYFRSYLHVSVVYIGSDSLGYSVAAGFFKFCIFVSSENSIPIQSSARVCVDFRNRLLIKRSVCKEFDVLCGRNSYKSCHVDGKVCLRLDTSRSGD